MYAFNIYFCRRRSLRSICNTNFFFAQAIGRTDRTHKSNIDQRQIIFKNFSMKFSLHVQKHTDLITLYPGLIHKML